MLAKTRNLTLGLGLVMVISAVASAPACQPPKAGLDLEGSTDCDPSLPECKKTVDGTGSRPPASALAPPKITTYKRSSLVPPFQLLQPGEQGRVNENNQPFSDLDYQSVETTADVASRMEAISAQINAERGNGSNVSIIGLANDQQVAQTIPFRGNPSDVKFVNVGGTGKAYIPLGGDVTTPGNEVTVVRTDGNMQLVKKITVGVRPQRLAVHPAGGLVFVCNQYSNYISIIDANTDNILTANGKPVEIPTHYYCADVAFVREDGLNTDKAKLFVANRWRHSVLEYQVNVVRDINNNPVGIEEPKEIAEILGVGNNPNRLVVDDALKNVWVANNKGGEVAKIDVATGKVPQGGRVTINGASTDIAVINDLVYVPTTTIDRGLPSGEETLPGQVNAAKVMVTGMDGQQRAVHPGALKDRTKSYNFEDLRNGIVQLDAIRPDSGISQYFTDDVSSEPNFAPAQKIVKGAVPTTIIRNKAGTRLFVALGATDTVQEFIVNTGARPNTLRSGWVQQLDHRPFGLALDEDTDRLFVSDWASERLEVLDMRSGEKRGKIDLDYANPPYPATEVEIGERFFYEATWSNNGRKSCATCHVDELDTDGVGYANGATAPTSYHQVKPNHNLLQTDSYFWNGSFGNGNYTSLAFAAQTRPNCQLIEFGFIDGISSDPRTRVGDRNNFGAQPGQDERCRPITRRPGSSEIENQAEIDQIVAQGVALQDQVIARVTRDVSKDGRGLSRRALSRAIDAYSVAELRIPPNPLTYAKASGQLDPAVIAQIDKGQQLFQSAKCSTCHNPNNARSPFADGLDHGEGAQWLSQFINTYQNNPLIQNIRIDINGRIEQGFSTTMRQANKASKAGPEINTHVAPIDYFIPFCFQQDNCVQFDDPLQVRGNTQEEERRLKLLIQFNLGDPDRTFIPGNVVGQVHINTPSLRGVWTQAALLHHGMATTIQEAILAPGHPALAPTDFGWAALPDGTKDVHGVTSTLSKDDVAALVRYVECIE